MKTKIFSLMLLVIVSGMYAQVPTSTNNLSNVQSLGNSNESIVLQIGDNDSEVIQHGDGNESDVSQSGLLNTSVVHQGYYPGPPNWKGDSNITTLVQVGDNNDSHLDQMNYGTIARENNATITQTGNKNTVLSQQYTDDNIVTVDQTGDRNDSHSVQKGSNSNRNYITQTSPTVEDENFGANALLNDSNVVQEGDNNVNTVNQNATVLGEENFSDVRQEGSFLTSMVTQNGITNSSVVKQYGWDHNSTVNQNGTGNNSNVVQRISATTTLTH